METTSNLPSEFESSVASAPFNVELALELSSFVHKECKDTPHDIGIHLAAIAHKHLTHNAVNDCSAQYTSRCDQSFKEAQDFRPSALVIPLGIGRQLENELNDVHEQLHKVRIRCSEWAEVAGKHGAEVDRLRALIVAMNSNK